MTEISKIVDNLYKETCPVTLLSGSLCSDDSRGEEIYFAKLIFKSFSINPITAVLVDLHVFDRANIEIEVVRDFLFAVESAERDREFGNETEIPVLSNAAKTISVAIRAVTFADDSVWEGSASLLFESIPELVTVESELEEPDTVSQFQRDFAKDMVKKENITALYVPFEYKDLWFCTCGEANHSDEKECFSCGAELEPQLSHIKNRIQLANNLAAYKAELAKKAEFQRVEAERLAALAAAAKAWEEKQAAEKKEKQELLRKKLRKTGIIAAVIIVPLIIAALIFLYVRQSYLIPQEKYNSAKALLENASYDEAIAAFNNMISYGDSSEMIVEAKFQKAEAQLAAGNFDEAITQYKALADKRDVSDRIKEANYLKACKSFDAKDYTKALTLFEGLEAYKDTAEKISTCNMQLAKSYAQKKDLGMAKKFFEKLSGADSVTIQKIFLKNGSELYKKGEEKNAAEYFSLVTDKELKASVDAVYYNKAKALLNDGKYEEAAVIFGTVKEYKDSKNLILSTYYLRAEEMFNAEDYKGAIALYKKAGAYTGAKDRIQECNYRLAGQMLSFGDYENARKAYEALGDYSDSASMVAEATYQIGYNQLQNGDVTGAYNTLYAIKWYDKAYALLISNSQFYIYIYDAGVGPNPLDGN